MKRRNFIKMLPVGFLAARFGFLAGPELKAVPIHVEILPMIEPGNPLLNFANIHGICIKPGESDGELRERLMCSIRETVVYV